MSEQPRESGFYWVRFLARLPEPRGWEPAEWNADLGTWNLCGLDPWYTNDPEDSNDDEIEVGPRITEFPRCDHCAVEYGSMTCQHEVID